MANLFWISAADLVKRLGDGPHTAASLLAAYNWTLTRGDATTCATYIDKNGLVQTAAANTLRVQYEDLNADGFRETPGILLEGSRTNSCLRSEELDNAVYSKLNVTVSANATAAPDGATTMDKVLETAVNGAHTIGQSITITAGEYLAATFHLKAAERTTGRVRVIAGADEFYVGFDLAAGTIGAAGAAGAATVTQSKITALGNSQYKVQITGKCNAGSVAASADVLLHDGLGNESYLGDITKGLYAWGIQLERLGTTGGFPSSYIKTVASAVTRVADSLTLPFNFGPFDTTIFYRVARPVWADASGDIGIFPTPYSLSGASPALLKGYGNQTTRFWNAQIDTATTDSVRSDAIPAGTELKVAAQYKNLTTGGQVAQDVGSGLSAFAGAATAFSAYANQTLRVGNSFGAGSELYGVLIDLKARQGLITLAAMQTEPGFSPANPIEVTELDAPGPLISKAQSGRVNLRSTQQIGRSWTERYLLQTTQASHKELLARMTQYWRNGTIFPKGHVDYAVPKGLGTGFVLVKGASQTGSTLVVDGCPLNTAGWLLAGDIFRVQGLPQVFQASADVNSEGDGTARIPLVVPIFTGGSPSDNATLTLTGVTMDVVLLEPPSFPTTSGVGSDYGELIIKLSEAL